MAFDGYVTLIGVCKGNCGNFLQFLVGVWYLMDRLERGFWEIFGAVVRTHIVSNFHVRKPTPPTPVMLIYKITAYNSDYTQLYMALNKAIL